MPRAFYHLCWILVFCFEIRQLRAFAVLSTSTTTRPKTSPQSRRHPSQSLSDRIRQPRWAARKMPNTTTNADVTLSSIPPTSIPSAQSASPEETTTTTTTKRATMNLITGMRDIIDRYDVFILDMWGVMHDGIKPYDGVLDVVKQLRMAGKELIVLSNSSKRHDHSIRMLEKLGFQPTHDFTKVITSGEVTFQILRGDVDAVHFIKNGLPLPAPPNSVCTAKNVFVFGSDRDDDIEYCETAGWKISPVQEASLLLARGTFVIHHAGSASMDVNDNTTLSSSPISNNSVIQKEQDATLYESLLVSNLEKAAKRQIPMIVSNPDKVRPDRDLSPMPGKIGDLYEQLLVVAANIGEGKMNEATTRGNSSQLLLQRIGKPFPEVYDWALADITDRSRVLMVGDALETDVAGGTVAGIDTLWVLLDGVYQPELDHAEDLEAASQSILRQFNQREGTYANGLQLSPNWIIPHFRW